MEIGDAALAAGMELVPGGGLARDLDKYDNQTRDYVAQFGIRPGTTLPLARGGHGATNAAAARSNLGLGSAAVFDAHQSPEGSSIPRRWSNASLTGPMPTSPGEYAPKRYVDEAVAGVDLSTVTQSAAAAQGTANAARNGEMFTAVYDRVVAGQRRSAWVQSDGLIGYAPSSERYKKSIRPEDVSDEQLLALQFVSFQWRAAVAVDDHREMGLIAEAMEAAGLAWACFYDSNGQVEGINYEMVSLAILPAVQRLLGRVAALERGHEGVEAS